VRALITGGSGGIGRAIASSLLSEEGHVVLLGRDESKLGAAVAELGPSASWRRADVANPREVRESVEAAVAELGGLDLLVTAAGYGTYFTTETPFDEAVRSWDEEVGVNLRGAFLAIQAGASHLTRPGGRIVTVSSIAAFTGGSSRPSRTARRRRRDRALPRFAGGELRHRSGPARQRRLVVRDLTPILAQNEGQEAWEGGVELGPA
jgi:NAD(P)-dependent dehydrogenase (short-subunit alcohol dehydrogenase family)